MTPNAHCFFATRSETGSNDPVPLQAVHLALFYEESISMKTQPLETMLPQASPKRKVGLKKKLTPKKL